MEGLGLVEDKEDSLDTATNVSADATFVLSQVKGTSPRTPLPFKPGILPFVLTTDSRLTLLHAWV